MHGDKSTIKEISNLSKLVITNSDFEKIIKIKTYNWTKKAKYTVTKGEYFNGTKEANTDEIFAHKLKYPLPQKIWVNPAKGPFRYAFLNQKDPSSAINLPLNKI